jgi:hypothetical protein
LVEDRRRLLDKGTVLDRTVLRGRQKGAMQIVVAGKAIRRKDLRRRHRHVDLPLHCRHRRREPRGFVRTLIERQPVVIVGHGPSPLGLEKEKI